MLNYKKLVLSAAICTLSSFSHAASYEFDNFTVDWDTVITSGVQFRIEDRDPTISRSSSGDTGAGDKDLSNLGAIVDNAFIINSNDGNNNFDKGITSERISILSEADFNFGDFGFFIRGKIFQDRKYGKSTDLSAEAYGSYNPNPVFGANGGFNAERGEYTSAAEDYAKTDAALLDAFFYGTFQLPYEKEVTVRIGRQVISWGEALLSGGGLTTGINHVDAHIRSQVGLELKELFLPSGAIFIQTQLTDSISLEAYYQYEWNPAFLDPSGTFFSEFDSIGDGGNTFAFITGEEKEILGKRLDLQPGDPDYNAEIETFYEFLPTNCPKGNETSQISGLSNQQYQDYRQLRCNALIQHRVRTDNASDQGQFGVAMNLFLESGAEMGFYFVNYHEKIPSFILPVDAVEAYAPLIEQLVNAPGIAEPGVFTPFTGIDDLGKDLTITQLTALLTFLSVLPEDQGTIGSITTDLVKNPWKIGLSDVTGGSSTAQFVLNALASAGVNLATGPLGFNTDSKVRSVNYRIKYFEDVRIYGFTYSTVLGGANVATEITYRQNTPLMGGDVGRTPSPSNLWNWHINTLLVLEPMEFFGLFKLWDFASFTAELLYWKAPGKLPFDINDGTNSKRLAVQNSPNGVGVSAFMGLEYFNVFSGWDINVPLYVNWGIDGSQFNAGYRDGQVIFATGMAFKHLSGLEIGSGITFLFGDTDDLFQTLVSDRDNAQLYVKYTF